MAFFCGFFSFALLAIVLTKEPLAFLAFIAFAAVALVLVAGLPLAFSGVGRSQHTAWLVPLSIPLGWTVVVWLGRLRHERYLSQFGIPGDAVPVANRSIYLAGLLPMAVPLGLALFTVAVDALLRHLHRVTHGGPFRLAEALLVFVAVLALTGFSDTYGAGTAARHAKSAAAAGHTPAPYYGLQATLVCVQPVSAAGRIPIANGPLPTGHPVVFFDASEDWIHLWDPARREARNAQQSITVRREDVQLMLTQRGKCP